jgi:uncharacterized membrane protein YkoI
MEKTAVAATRTSRSRREMRPGMKQVMKKPTGVYPILLLMASLLASAFAAGENPQFTGSIAVAPKAKQLEALAKVTLVDALAAAPAPGPVLEAALEVEDGYLVYGIDFYNASGVHTKTLVDAGTGKVLITLGDEQDQDTLQVEEGDQSGDNENGPDEADLTPADAAKAKVSVLDAVKAASAAVTGQPYAVKLDSGKEELAYEVQVLDAAGKPASVMVNALTGRAAPDQKDTEGGSEDQNGQNEGDSGEGD